VPAGNQHHARQLLATFKKVKSAIAYRNRHLPSSLVSVKDGRMYGTNSRMTASTPCDLNVDFQVHGEDFERALVILKDDVKIERNPQSISLSRGKAEVILETREAEILLQDAPEKWAAIPDGFTTALRQAAQFMSDDRTKPYFCGVWLDQSAVYATDNVCAIEAEHKSWEGIVGITLPDWVIECVLKRDDALSEFAYSDKTVSFSFDDGSWITSDRAAREMPDEMLALVRDVVPPAFELSADWRDAYETALKMCKNELVIGPVSIRGGREGVDIIVEAVSPVREDT
jgi:hypothetical protein